MIHRRRKLGSTRSHEPGRSAAVQPRQLRAGSGVIPLLPLLGNQFLDRCEDWRPQRVVPEQAVVELGVEDRHLDAVGSDDVAVLVLQAPD